MWVVRACAQCSAAPIALDGEAGAACHPLLPFIPAYDNAFSCQNCSR